MDIESPNTGAGKAPEAAPNPTPQVKRSTFSADDEVLFKVKRIHGYHGTVINGSDDSAVVVRINEEALEGDIVIFPADVLVAVPSTTELKTHHSSRLPWDYKS